MLDGCDKCKVDPTISGFVERFISLHKDMSTDLFLGEVNRDDVFKYIILTYDVKSPYVLKYKEWAQRRRETAKESGFPTKEGKYIPEAERIILGKNQNVNKLIIRYLFLQNDIDFIRYQSYQALYFKQIKDSLEKDFEKPSDYDKLKQNIDILADELKSLQNAIFFGDETGELKKALYDFAGKISTDFRPEDVAKRLNEEKPIVDEEPYPKDYKVSDLKFIGDE